MWPLLNLPGRLPDPGLFQLEKYDSSAFSLSRLTPGVDNTRFDVQLSPDLRKSCGRLADVLMERCSDESREEGSDTEENAVAAFRDQCREVLRAAVDQAKMAQEIQVDYLARTAVVKMLLEESRESFTRLTDRLSELIWKQESGWYSSRGGSSTPRERELIALKERLATVRRSRGSLLTRVRMELFRHLREAQAGEVRELRQANFGVPPKAIDDIFDNLLLTAGKRPEAMFMVEHYILLGNRMEDPDSYESLLALLKGLYRKVTTRRRKPLFEEHEYDSLLREVDNVDVLLNWEDARLTFKTLKDRGAGRKELRRLRRMIRARRRVASYFFEQFRRAGLLESCTAFYVMQPLFPAYCPPLTPAQLLHFVEEGNKNPRLADHIRRLQKFYGQSAPLARLRRKAKRINKVRRRQQQAYMIRYIRDFCLFHRDTENAVILRRAMEHVNLVEDTKTINLSRVNNTLYSFLLPHETVLDLEDKPLINHTIVKADIRGATEITHQLLAKGLNPATYFSLNFFEPVNEILDEFGATKVFLEGDAMILALGERKDSPSEWYSVARACGLAREIIRIVGNCNRKNRKTGLPPLEIGCGICFADRPPTYLFDGDRRILISLAINLADRLSSCAKQLRSLRNAPGRLHDLYVFEPEGMDKPENAADDYHLRFNVNGVELGPGAFEKLGREIRLEKKVLVAGKERLALFHGTYPTASGAIRKLTIRQGQVMRISTEQLRITGKTGRPYYEVIDEEELLRKIEERARGQEGKQ